MTDDWSVTLPREYARRVENKSLVLWRKGITCWADVWTRKKGDTQQKMFDWVRQQVSEHALEKWEMADSEPKRVAYMLLEKEGGEPRWALYCYALGDASHVMMAIYFDDRADLKEAKEIWLSLQPHKG